MKKVLSVLLFLAAPALAADIGIAAVVSGDIITTFEVANHRKLASTMAARTKKPAPDARESLIENRLKLQEGAKFQISATDQEIKDGLARFRKYANLEADAAYKSFVASSGGEEALRAQLAADIVWQKLVWQVLRGYVNASGTEVGDALGGTSDVEYSFAGDADCRRGLFKLAASEMDKDFRKRVEAVDMKAGDAIAVNQTAYVFCGRRDIRRELDPREAERARSAILAEKLEAYASRYLEKMINAAAIERK